MATQFDADNLGSSKPDRQPIPMGVLVPTTRTNAEALGIADKVESGRLAGRRNIARPCYGGPLVPRLPGA